MDTPSKERLVGAIIFVVLIVLLVPEILSGPRRAAPTGGASAGGTTRTYTIDLGNPVKPAATQVVEAKPTSLPPPPPPAVVPEQQPPAATPPATQAAQSTAAAKSTVATPSTAPAAKPAVVAPAAAGKESWGAQLGSFSKAANAERLAASLRAKGYHAFVSPIGTGSHVLHRVRVGPEPTRAGAEALVARLKRDGQTASVVTLP
jgi:DedD protein